MPWRGFSERAMGLNHRQLDSFTRDSHMTQGLLHHKKYNGRGVVPSQNVSLIHAGHAHCGPLGINEQLMRPPANLSLRPLSTCHNGNVITCSMEDAIAKVTMNCSFQLQVWDTAGQERFRTITRSYYRSAHGAMVVYDITRLSTFDSITHWIREVEQYGSTSVVVILLGNKSDLHANRQVLFEDACTLSEKYKVLAALETSAKEAQNVEAAFVLMARELLARNGMTVINEVSLESPQFTLNSSQVNGTSAPDKNCQC